MILADQTILEVPGTMFRSRAALVVVAVTILVGCSSVPIPPTYTQDELKAICERHGGWWHPDELVGGFCEQDSRV